MRAEEMFAKNVTEVSPVGSGQFVYEPVICWEQLPEKWTFVEAVGVAADSQDRVFVFNRGEHPVIVFDREGRFLDAWGEGQFVRPHGIWIGPDDLLYLTDDQDHAVKNAELGRRAGMFPWMKPDFSTTGGRISVFDSGGNLLARFGGGDRPSQPGDFFAPHDIWVDSHGDVYVGEVTWSAGGKDRLVPVDCPSLQKFIRKR